MVVSIPPWAGAGMSMLRRMLITKAGPPPPHHRRRRRHHHHHHPHPHPHPHPHRPHDPHSPHHPPHPHHPPRSPHHPPHPHHPPRSPHHHHYPHHPHHASSVYFSQLSFTPLHSSLEFHIIHGCFLHDLSTFPTASILGTLFPYPRRPTPHSSNNVKFLIFWSTNALKLVIQLDLQLAEWPRVSKHLK